MESESFVVSVHFGGFAAQTEVAAKLGHNCRGKGGLISMLFLSSDVEIRVEQSEFNPQKKGNTLTSETEI